MNDKILVVDDNEINIDILKEFLEDEDYIVESTKNGYKALEKLENDDIDLIIMDIIMPGIDGYQLTKLIKDNDKTKNIPIIIATAHPSVKDELDEKEIAVDDYIIKPYNFDYLLNKIEELISNYKNNKN